MPNRSLAIDNEVVGVTESGTCTACGAKFKSHRKDIGDALKQLIRDWERHNCKEDASQAAARIAREATKD